MDYFSLGDSIDYSDFNALVYLLRKFKRLTNDLKLGSSTIESDYGSFSVTGGLESVGGNYIIESPVTISSSDVLKNCFYSFVFNVVDVNLSGEVNRRQVSVTGDTGDTGVLEVTLPTTLLESDEVLLPEFTLDIIFDPHEYYTPMSSLNIELVSDVTYLGDGDTATITATITDNTGTPIPNLDVLIRINDDTVSEITDENGEVETTYTGTGTTGKVVISVGTESIVIYDGGMISTVFTDETITLGKDTNGIQNWLYSNDDVTIDWGDGTTSTVNNPTTPLTHTYSDGLENHTVWFGGDITRLGVNCFKDCDNLVSIDFIYDDLASILSSCFMGVGLSSIIIPEGVTYISSSAFSYCDNLVSISIPASVTKIGKQCFLHTSIKDYQLYWKGGKIIEYDEIVMYASYDTYFTVPKGESMNYINKGYPHRIYERGGLLTTTTLISDSSSITVGESITLSGSVTESNTGMEDVPVKIYQNNTLIDTLTTDSNGEFEKEITGLTDGLYKFKAIYDGDMTYERSESSIVNVTVNKIGTNISLSAVESSIDIGDTPEVTGTLLSDGVGLTGASVKIYQDNTLVDTVTTTTGGAFSYTGDATTSTGSLLFKAVYEGTSTYAECNSNVVTITVAIPYVLTTNDVTMGYKDGTQFIATVTKDGEPYGVGETVTFVINDNSYNRTIDANGQAKMNLSLNPGTYTMTTTYGLITNTNTVIINKVPTTTSLSAVESTITVGDAPEVTGTLTSGGTGVTGASVKIYNGSSLVDTVHTGSGGSFSYTGSPTSTTGSLTFKAVFDGTTEFYGSESGIVTITVAEPTQYSLSIQSDKQTMLTTESATISGNYKVDGTGVSGETITIYDGSTSLGTCTTGSGGAYSKTISGLSAGTHTIKASHTNVDSTSISISVDYPVILTTADVTMSYHDGTQFIATVTKNGQPYGVGETVTFTLNGIEYPRTIDANGQAKLNLNTFAGTYTITSTFGSLTNTNTVVINKASTTTTLTASSSSILTTDTLTLSGAVTGNSMGGYSVKIYDGATLIDTVSSSSGTYTKTLTGLSVGTHTFKAVYDGDANHNSSESSVVTVTVTAPLTPDTITVTGTPTIQTGDTDTITATLLAGSTAVAGETLSYEIKHGTTTIDSGSDTTDSNGQISFTYTGTGVGDVDVIVKYGNLLQETFVIQDCISAYADTDSTKWTLNGATGTTFNSNGLSIVNSNWANITLTQQLTQGISIQYKITALGGSATEKLYYNFGDVGGNFKTNGFTYQSSSTTYTMTNAVIRFEIANNTIKIYLDDVLKVTDTWSANTFQMAFSMGNNRSATIKDLIIKAL